MGNSLMITCNQKLREQYSLFNKKYFEGQLPERRFSIRFFQPRRNTRCWGYITHRTFSMNNNPTRYDVTELCISTDLKADQKKLNSTLLHEMIHVYQAEVKKQNPTHRKLFKAWCRHLNAVTKSKYGVIS
nr:hypothetical protein [uncultured Mediterranean phage uvMED]BAR25519.1 hypothetical protein [uncultured Mediterranean phage uvMED]